MDQASAYYDQEAYCPPDPLILYFQFRLLWGAARLYWRAGGFQ